MAVAIAPGRTVSARRTNLPVPVDHSFLAAILFERVILHAVDSWFGILLPLRFHLCFPAIERHRVVPVLIVDHTTDRLVGVLEVQACIHVAKVLHGRVYLLLARFQLLLSVDLARLGRWVESILRELHLELQLSDRDGVVEAAVLLAPVDRRLAGLCPRLAPQILHVT